MTQQRRLYFEEVMRLYYEEGYNTYEIASMVPVSQATVWTWISKFAAQSPKLVENMKKPKTEAKPQADKDADIKSLEEEIARLTYELKRSNMKAAALDTMINLAEERFKIQIRKKSGTKQ